MDKEQDKNIEKLVDKIMKDDDLTSISSGFTDAIMAQVEQINKQETFVYKPLISKKIWLLICSVIIGVSAYIAFYGNLTKSKWFTNIEFDFSFDFLPEFNFSNTMLYATIIVSVLFLIQIFVLKNYFNKRLST